MAGAQASTWVVALGDVSVCLRAADRRRWRALVDLLPVAPPHPGPVTAEIVYGVEAPAIPSMLPELQLEDVSVWRTAGGCVLRDEAGVGARIDGGVALIGGEADLLEWRYRRMFHLAAAELLAVHGRFVLHAAGIVCAGGVRLAFGETGTGKSTLALAAVEGGHLLLGDDMVVVRPAAGRLEASGLGTGTAVPGDLGGSAIARGCALDDDRGRWALPIDRLASGWHPVVGSIEVRHGSELAGTVRPASQQRGLQVVLRSFGGARLGPHLWAFFPHAGLLARLPHWELRHAADPAVRLAAARRMLRECCS